MLKRLHLALVWIVTHEMAASTETGGGPPPLGALVIGSVANRLDLVGQPVGVNYMVEGAICCSRSRSTPIRADGSPSWADRIANAMYRIETGHPHKNL